MEIKKKADLLLENFKEWSEQQTNIKGVAVVGSFARGDYHSNSDVDLTIISTNKDLTLLWLFFPLTQFMLNLDFKMNKSERKEVVEMVEQGTLKPNVSYDSSLIHLPEKYDQLSKGGGEIIIEKNGNLILFFTYRGILDNFSGFVYLHNDKKPRQSDFDGDFKQIERLDENWYFVGLY